MSLSPWLLVILFFQEAQCWGPYTHAAFGSLYVHSRDSLPAFLHGRHASSNDTLEAVFVTANAFPDAFKEERSWMHSFDYAAFQLEQSALWSGSGKSSWTNSIDFIQSDAIKAYSYGYMMHLLEDYVGHHNQGYLNPKKDHLLELDVDTLFYLVHQKDYPPWQYRDRRMLTIFDNKQAKEEIVSFVADISQHYAELNIDMLRNFNGAYSHRGEGGLSKKQVERCINQFSRLLRMESFAMRANTRTYKSGMVQYDVCHAKSFVSANATLNTAMEWTKEALNVFQQHIFPYPQKSISGESKVQQAIKLAQDWVERAFKSHGGSVCSTMKAVRSRQV